MKSGINKISEEFSGDLEGGIVEIFGFCRGFVWEVLVRSS